ncbi:MAG: hypothetical protein ACTSW1_17785 [Candidatus Hodarchaeales archaeon]
MSKLKISIEKPKPSEEFLKSIEVLVKNGEYKDKATAIKEEAKKQFNSIAGSVPGSPEDISKQEMWALFTEEKKKIHTNSSG